MHLHLYKKVGDQTGYYGLAVCRCGKEKLIDLNVPIHSLPITAEREEKIKQELRTT